MEVAIIGGGIGGLTTALVLKRLGIPYRLYEAAPELKAVGAGIVMANNAMQVFRQLGIAGMVAARGHRLQAMRITRADFTTLSRTSLGIFEQQYGLQNHAIHRAELHRILAGQLEPESISLGKRLNAIKPSENGYILGFEDGSSARANYVIGADGLRSRVRDLYFGPQELRHSGQLCYRGVLPYTLPEPFQQEAVEAWGLGRRFGLVQLKPGTVYWYLVLDQDLHEQQPDPHAHSAHFHPLAGELMRQTAADQWIFAPIYDLKPMHTWTRERICLLGDAAHATTPNLGQGACQAIEDAWMLYRLLQQHSLDEAFQLYPERRRAKAHHVVQTSWRIGRISQIRNPLLAGLRNVTLRYLSPQSLQHRQLGRLFRLDPAEGA